MVAVAVPILRIAPLGGESEQSFFAFLSGKEAASLSPPGRWGALLPVLRQNSPYLYFQYFSLSFFQSVFGVSKFDLGVKGSLITAC
jgi:hypothetical protein